MNDGTEPGRATPSRVPCNDGLGLAFPERDYLAWDPFGDERDTDVRCRTVALKRARKQHPCMLGAGSYGDGHSIAPGELYRYESAFVDGDHWGRYAVCIRCMDKWLTDIGRTPASHNAKLTGPSEGH